MIKPTKPFIGQKLAFGTLGIATVYDIKFENGQWYCWLGAIWEPYSNLS